MRQIYSPVCTLAQQHGYFQQPATASVRLAPTPDTAEKLRRACLLLKATELGLVLLRALPEPGPNEPAAPVRPLPDFLFPLRFVVQPISPEGLDGGQPTGLGRRELLGQGREIPEIWADGLYHEP